MLSNYCPECKVVCGGKFCWRCGKRSVAGFMECLECRNETSIVGNFCGFCGKPIQEAIREHVQKEREKGGEKSGDTV